MRRVDASDTNDIGHFERSEKSSINYPGIFSFVLTRATEPPAQVWYDKLRSTP